MSPPPAAPTADNATEFTVDVHWALCAGASGYVLLERQIPDSWKVAKRHSFPAEQANATIDGLMPTSTYQFKLIVSTSEGESESSSEVTIDTQVGSCTPKPKCAVL